MKKIISLILVLTLIMSLSTAVFAANGKNENKGNGKVISKIEEHSARLGEIKTLSDQLKANNKQIRDLRGELKTNIGKLRVIIENLKTNTTNLTQEQIDELNTVLAQLKKDRHEFGTNHKFKLNEKMPGLRSAKKNKDLAAVKASFDSIFAEQQSRINDLKTLIEKVKTMITLYSAISTSAPASSAAESAPASSEAVSSSVVSE